MRVLLTYDPLIEDYVYRPIVPFGESLEVTAMLDATGDVQFDRIVISQDDRPWLEISRVDPITTLSRDGISCALRFGEQDMALRITNGNASGKQVVLRVTPGFTVGQRKWLGKDPQIVLPPEKSDGGETDELSSSG